MLCAPSEPTAVEPNGHSGAYMARGEQCCRQCASWPGLHLQLPHALAFMSANRFWNPSSSSSQLSSTSVTKPARECRPGGIEISTPWVVRT
jgi:hypothetical protein